MDCPSCEHLSTGLLLACVVTAAGLWVFPRSWQPVQCHRSDPRCLAHLSVRDSNSIVSFEQRGACQPAVSGELVSVCLDDSLNATAALQRLLEDRCAIYLSLAPIADGRWWEACLVYARDPKHGQPPPLAEPVEKSGACYMKRPQRAAPHHTCVRSRGE